MKHVLFVVVIGLLAKASFSCSCRPWKSVKDAFDSYSGVFIGLVTKIEPSQEDRPKNIAQVLVSETFKGHTKQQVTVESAQSTAACGYPMKEGEKYIFFAMKNKNNHSFSVNMCSMTGVLEDSSEIIKELEGLVD